MKIEGIINTCYEWHKNNAKKKSVISSKDISNKRKWQNRTSISCPAGPKIKYNPSISSKLDSSHNRKRNKGQMPSGKM